MPSHADGVRGIDKRKNGTLTAARAVENEERFGVTARGMRCGRARVEQAGPSPVNPTSLAAANANTGNGGILIWN
jgi:hypothetical protein